jgi:hypothetical protein
LFLSANASIQTFRFAYVSLQRNWWRSEQKGTPEVDVLQAEVDRIEALLFAAIAQTQLDYEAESLLPMGIPYR